MGQPGLGQPARVGLDEDAHAGADVGVQAGTPYVIKQTDPGYSIPVKPILGGPTA
jgi:hypothetical protein